MTGTGCASPLCAIISGFGREVTRKLLTGKGSREDHLRGPLERMLIEFAKTLGLKVTPIGETRLPDLSVRPDYAVDVWGVRTGYIELKQPGYGIPGTWRRPDTHDKKQWAQLQLLPNVLYSDGQTFGRYHFGKLQGRVARLQPNLDRAGDKLRAVDSEFELVLEAFLRWEPERPRTLDELVPLMANLCRLLRDDVVLNLKHEQHPGSIKRTFTGLANDWRQVLFPNLTDSQFADQYAQTVTFALLLARVNGVSFHDRSIGEIARLLGKKHSFMGKALGVLTAQSDDEHSVALTTMLRVLSVVDWSEFPEDSYATLYETFLTKYDPALRRKSGIYYTPAQIVSFMTRFVDDILRDRLDRPLGFADDGVIVVDPAMGTGSFLADVINRVAETVADEEGPGGVTPRLRELSNRLIGFENQAAPYAIAELRIHSLLKKRHRADIPLKERRFLSDTLDDPDLQLLPMGSLYEAIKQVRDDANVVKRSEPVMVVIGNPPYGDKAKGSTPWIETPSKTISEAPSIKAFQKPGNRLLEWVLANKYVYFWRWATWKTFDAHPDHPAGVVAMICPAGFTWGVGFAGMREYLRRTTDEGWIIDLSPEGHQPSMNTRVFRGNQQPICIAVFIRQGQPTPGVAAQIHRAVVSGKAEEKYDGVHQLKLDDLHWRQCSDEWTAPFGVISDTAWTAIPATKDLIPWSAPGVKPNRTWVYAPERGTLEDRWSALVTAPPEDKAALFKESDARSVNQEVDPIPGMSDHTGTIHAEAGLCPTPCKIAYRSFDRQLVIPDARVHHRPSPPLWYTYSPEQIFMTEQHTVPSRGGIGLSFTNLIPDMDHFMGHHGGRVFPLYRDNLSATDNVTPGLLAELGRRIGLKIRAIDLFSYTAAITAHRGYTERFAMELRTPGIRIPLTAQADLWQRAVDIGKEVLWLHTYGERCVDPSAGRPKAVPKMHTDRPRVTVTIPDSEEGMPSKIEYDENALTLKVGEGRIYPVSAELWNYHVSGMLVIKHWFGYRKKNPAGKRTSKLDDIVPNTWTPHMTTELLNLLNVLGRCVALEPRQAELLDEIMATTQITVAELEEAGVLPAATAATKPPKPTGEPDLFSMGDE